MANQLANSQSPYLRQHAENPVHWLEWSEEAFAKAKTEGKPVFLSIGYSSCHWCHVMAHESFEDEGIAAILNEHFICIKVDREERPDVDEVYMMAVQAISGRGGWPMSVFLTPDKKPFFAGTYFPREDRGKYPGFGTLIRQLAGMWQTRRSEVLASAQEIGTALSRSLGKTMSSVTSTIEPKLFDECFQAQRSAYDAENGGFGDAPKFPAHSTVLFLMDYAGVSETNAPEALGMALGSLTAITMGGIQDHVGGGFHRYSTDARWHLPHFEKMLSDNALLLTELNRASIIADTINFPGAELFVRGAMGIIEWVRREMTAEDGTFFTAQDADSEGEEGRFYTWTTAEIERVLGESASEFCAAFGVMPEGNFLDEATQTPTGRNVLSYAEDRASEFKSELAALLRARQDRPAPGIDNKAIAAQNGMMISALAECGETLSAEKCAHVWLQHVDHLPHQIVNGTPGGMAFLDDYAHLALGFARLAEATGNPAYREASAILTQRMVELFADEGGFFFTSEQHETLLGRTKPCMDNALPSPNAMAIQALLLNGRIEEAQKHLMAVVGMAQSAPQACESLIHQALLLQSVPTATVVEAAPIPKPMPVAKVTARLESKELKLENGVAKGSIHIDIPDGLHLNTHTPPARWLTPTEAFCEPVKMSASYPTGTEDRYEGQITITFELHSPEPTDFEVTLKFQACTEQECLAPDEIRLDGRIR